MHVERGPRNRPPVEPSAAVATGARSLPCPSDTPAMRPGVEEVRLLANCSVGLGFSYRSFQAGLERDPHMIGCDAGSSDGGPFLLGARKAKAGTAAKRDLAIMIEGALRKNIPLVIGSCGATGGNAGVTEYMAIVTDVLQELRRHAVVATIFAEVSQQFLRSKLRRGSIKPHGEWPMLTPDDVDQSSSVVAMMGVEPIVRALEGGAQIVLAGRCCDPAIFACVPLMLGIPAGIAWHAAKSLDKGYLATTEPLKGSSIMACLTSDSFTVEPMKDDVSCTVASVARQTLHENLSPFEIVEPGGTLLTGDANYEQLDGRTVRVTGSAFMPANPYTLKLEGAAPIGHRAIVIAGIRDPRTLALLEEYLAELTRMIHRAASSMRIPAGDYSVNLRVYGRDAVLGSLEPDLKTVPKEVGLIIDIVASDEDLAASLAARASATGSRLDIAGGLEGGGNFAYPFSPRIIPVGPVFRWSVWHTVEIDVGELDEIFDVRLERV